MPLGPDGVCGTGDDVAIGSDVTDANGNYLFTGLGEGVYCADPDETTVPDGLELTTDNDPETVDLGPGENFLDADFGYQPLGSIGDTVWQDNNGNGVQDPGEPGIPGVTVDLNQPGPDGVCGTGDDVAIGSDVTDANGNYLFTGLGEGVYCADPDETTVPDGLELTTDNDPETVDLGPGENFLDADFGYQPLGSIGDTVWQDNNGNGVQDPGEPGIPGVTVDLNQPGPDGVCGTGDDVNIGSDVTDANGNYLFTGLGEGIYCADPDETTVPDGLELTTDNDPETVDLGPGENFLDADFGYQPLGSIGDTVWQDNNGNGVQDPGEPGIPGVTVDLNQPGPDGVCGTGDDVSIGSDVTDANGNYLFTGLGEGAYCADPDETTVPDGYLLTTDNDPETVDLGPGENFLDADFGYQPLTCGLVIDKTCAVQQPPSTAWNCSDAKPIDQLWMIWNGTQPAKITAWKGDVGSTLLATIDNIQPGEKVTVDGYAGSPNDVVWEVFAAGTNSKLGESKFHLSCSDDNMNGPEDCGLAQGNGKGDDSGFLNLWLLEGMAGSGQSFLCTPEPEAPQQACTVTGVPIPSCQVLKDNGQKLTSVTFQYTGGGCNDSDNTQDPSKATCSGSINPALSISVANDNGYSIVPTAVAPDGEFTVSDSSFDSNSVFTLSNGGGTETLEIHTSCSQPLAVGDVFGSLTVTAINGDDGGADVTYFYEVTNLGDLLTGVSIADDKLGDIAGPFSLDAGESQIFQATTNIFETTTNTAFASGFLANGEICPTPAAEDSVTVTVEEPCDVCKGGTVELTLEYQGASGSQRGDLRRRVGQGGQDPVPGTGPAWWPDHGHATAWPGQVEQRHQHLREWRVQHQDPHELLTAHRPQCGLRRLPGRRGLQQGQRPDVPAECVRAAGR